MRLVRRDFLRVFVVAAAPVPLACSSDDSGGRGKGKSKPPPTPEQVLETFPQGIASGDPKPGSVILWTRVEPEDPADSVSVDYEVALDEAFDQVVAEGTLEAEPGSDHTVRLKVTGLSPRTSYHYRFTARGIPSETGRTRTAPAEDDDVPIRLAFASCQDRIGRYYHAWRVLADREEDQLDLVLFLGDYVYETTGDPSFQQTGSKRTVDLPDGMDLPSEFGEGSSKAAKTLADYRALYKAYRSDPDLRRAHRLFPFVAIWDDHEFTDDAWQDHATYFNEAMGDEKDTARREAATRAWFEYMPADVEHDSAAGYPDDLRIYRSLRFGRHVELFLTDQRYYRSDHVIPEGPADLSVGKISENSSLGSRFFVLKSGFDTKEQAAAPTMLGAEQKKWLVDSVKGSTATWKLWGSEVQASQMTLDLSAVDTLPATFRDRFYLGLDQWDGYRSERAEILASLGGTDNLVVLAGDVHAFYASELHADFDDDTSEPTAVEYVTAGISSGSLQSTVERVLSSNDALKGLGLLDLVPQLDDRLLEANTHRRYGNSLGNGVAVAQIDASELAVTYLEVGDVLSEDFDGEVVEVQMRTKAGSNRVEVL